MKYKALAQLDNEFWDKHNEYENLGSILARLQQSNIGKITCVGCNISTRPECIDIIFGT